MKSLTKLYGSMLLIATLIVRIYDLVLNFHAYYYFYRLGMTSYVENRYSNTYILKKILNFYNWLVHILC